MKRVFSSQDARRMTVGALVAIVVAVAVVYLGADQDAARRLALKSQRLEQVTRIQAALDAAASNRLALAEVEREIQSLRDSLEYERAAELDRLNQFAGAVAEYRRIENERSSPADGALALRRQREAEASRTALSALRQAIEAEPVPGETYGKVRPR